MAPSIATRNDIQEASQEVTPSSFLDYKVYLQSLYLAVKNKVEKYSYHKFAEDLGFGATNVIHQLVKGHRPLTLKTAQKMATHLGLKGPEKKYFLTMVEYCNAKTTIKREQLFNDLITVKNSVLPTDNDKDWLEFLSEWFHPVIREFIGIDAFEQTPEWIAENINPKIRPEQVKKSLLLLERLELIAFDETKKRFVQTAKRVSTGHRVRGIGFVRYHQKLIELAKEALTRVAGEERDISSMTMSVNERAYQELKSMIHEFQIKALNVADESEQSDRVYHLNIQFFPSSK